jgi:adenosine deaminase
MNRDDFYDKLKKIPKAELHLHAEGMVSHETVLSLYERAYPEKKYTQEDIEQLFKFNDFSDFISAFIAIQQIFTIDDFPLLLKDMEKYFLRNGIVYAEVFIAPTSFIRAGMDFFKIMDTMVGGSREMKKNHGIEIRYLIDVSRGFGLENALKNLDLIIGLNKKYPEVIGVGLGGDENKGPAREFAEAFEKAEEAGLKLVAHAGEVVGAESIEDAVTLLHASRIGHGISSVFSESVQRLLSEKGVALECCPTSNVFTKFYVKKIEDHPIKPLYKNGVPITLNSDDPTFFNVELLDEFYNLYKYLDFSLEDIKKLICNSFEYSFLSSEQKKEYLNAVSTQWQVLFS